MPNPFEMTPKEPGAFDTFLGRCVADSVNSGSEPAGQPECACGHLVRWHGAFGLCTAQGCECDEVVR